MWPGYTANCNSTCLALAKSSKAPEVPYRYGLGVLRSMTAGPMAERLKYRNGKLDAESESLIKTLELDFSLPVLLSL